MTASGRFYAVCFYICALSVLNISDKQNVRTECKSNLYEHICTKIVRACVSAYMCGNSYFMYFHSTMQICKFNCQSRLIKKMRCYMLSWRFGIVVILFVNEVTLHRTQLVSGCVTIFSGYITSACNQPCIPPGLLN